MDISWTYSLYIAHRWKWSQAYKHTDLVPLSSACVLEMIALCKLYLTKLYLLHFFFSLSMLCCLSKHLAAIHTQFCSVVHITTHCAILQIHFLAVCMCWLVPRLLPLRRGLSQALPLLSGESLGTRIFLAVCDDSCTHCARFNKWEQQLSVPLASYRSQWECIPQ